MDNPNGKMPDLISLFNNMPNLGGIELPMASVEADKLMDVIAKHCEGLGVEPEQLDPAVLWDIIWEYALENKEAIKRETLSKVGK